MPSERCRPEGIQIEPSRADLRDGWTTGSTRPPRQPSAGRRVSKRREAEAIEHLINEYLDGTTAAELGQRYGLAKSSVLRLVRDAGERVPHPRLSASETAQLVALHEAGLSQVDIAERLGRRPSAVWHCLRRLGFVGSPRSASD
jgi:hypothetical protein